MASSDTDSVKRFIHSRMNKFLGEVLSTAEILSKNSFQYETIRKKTLRQGNDALRDIFAELDCYEVEAGPNARTRTDKYDLKED